MVTLTAEKVMDRYPLQLDTQVLRSVLEDTEKQIALNESFETLKPSGAAIWPNLKSGSQRASYQSTPPGKSPSSGVWLPTNCKSCG